MVGTEQGYILTCNKKGKNEKVTHVYGTHHGPVYAIQRNHHIPKYFLSIGDWTARVQKTKTETERIKYPT